MAWKRLILLVVVLVALVVLTIQNLSPSLPLVFLGGQTQALPLAFWLLCAIALGSLITILIALLTTRPPSREGWRRRPAGFSVPPQDEPRDRSTNRQSYDTNYGFSASATPRSDSAYASGYRSDYQSAYEPDYRANYGTDQASTRSKAANPVNQAGRKISDWMSNWGQFSRRQYMDWDERDRGLEEWEDWEGYENLHRPQPPRDEFDELEDLERDRNSTYTPPPRDYEPRSYEPPNYEAAQEPEETYRSGSAYSYSYRKAGDTGGHVDNIYDRSDDDEPETIDPQTVYDADYRVLTPPQYPEAETPDDYGDPYDSGYSDDYQDDSYASDPGYSEPDYVDDNRDRYSSGHPQWRDQVPPDPVHPQGEASQHHSGSPQSAEPNPDAEPWEDWDSFIERKQQDDKRW
ncbi:MAG: hypothetical protein ACTS2F_17670 [Thainema sp.]